MSERKIHFGSQSFRKLREENKVYIDKTGFINEFLSEGGAEVSIITRPRRFGKTLLLDTLREFFDRTKDSSKLFDGLAVSQDKELCAKWMNKYPVIYLKLNEIKSLYFADSYENFEITAGRVCSQYSYLLNSSKVSEFYKIRINALLTFAADESILINFIRILCEAIYKDCGIRPIILIDEYDAPLSKIEGEEDYKKMASFLDLFFEISLKSNNYFEFAIMTGCLRYATDGITTGFNNYTNFDLNDRSFEDKFGFTQAEVQSLLAEQGFSDKMDKFQEWYGGYCIGNSYPIYCPCDVLQYICDLKTFSETEPQAYWYNIGSHSLVRQFIDKLDVLNVGKDIATLLQGGTVTEECYGSMKYKKLYDARDFWTELYLKGYLTKVHGKKAGHSFQPVELRIPNTSVYYLFMREMASWFRNLTGDNSYRLSLVNEALWNGDEQTVSQLVSELVRCDTCCQDNPHISKEALYHAILLGLLSSLYYNLFSGIESGTGLPDILPDILIEDREHNRAIVIKIKYTDKKTSLKKEAESALAQSQDRQYTAPLLARKRTVLTWGLAFCPRQCLAKCGQA